MALSGFLGERNLRKVDVLINAPEDVHAGMSVPLAIRCANTRRFLPVFLLRVVVGNQYVLFPYIAPGSADVRHLPWVFVQRGRQTIGQVHVASVFPFAFFVRRRRSDATFDGIVFPRIGECPPGYLADAERRYAGDRVLNAGGLDGEPVSVRNYVHGDPFKYIHWKASARSGGLKTKELAAVGQPPVMIDFEASPISGIEDRIACVTGALVHAARRGVPIGLKIGGRVFPPTVMRHQQRQILKELALYGSA